MQQEHNRNSKNELQEQIYKSTKKSFGNLVKMCEKAACRRRTILQFFAENPAFSVEEGCKNCDYCTNPERVEKLVKRVLSSTRERYNLTMVPTANDFQKASAGWKRKREY